MNTRQLEAMARLLAVADHSRKSALSQGWRSIADAIAKDMKILAEYGAVHTAAPSDDFTLAKNGIFVDRDITGEVK